MDLQSARDAIRETDAQMAKLFVERMEAARAIAAFKCEKGLPVEDLQQEQRVLDGCATLISDDEMRPFYLQFVQATIDVSKRWQQHLMQGDEVL